MLSRRALLFIRRRDILIIKIYTLLPRLMICEFKSNVDDKKKKKFFTFTPFIAKKWKMSVKRNCTLFDLKYETMNSILMLFMTSFKKITFHYTISR